MALPLAERLLAMSDDQRELGERSAEVLAVSARRSSRCCSV